MENQTRPVDGFRFLPPSLGAWIRALLPEHEFRGEIPWTPVTKPLSKLTFSLVTSAGVSLRSDPPFDMEREKREPTWGDRSYRVLPRGTTARDVTVRHLHINTSYIEQDLDVMLPLGLMEELEKEGIIGRLAPSSYSFYGFQWESTEFLEQAIEPMSRRMKEEGVDAVLLTPA